MRLRTAKFGDFASVLKIYDEGYEEVKRDPNFGDYLRLTKPDLKRKRDWTAATYKKVMNRHMVFCVAEERGEIVGFCYVEKKDLPDSEMSHVGVLAIRVARGWRGRGIGTKLLAYTLKRCRRRFEIIELWPFATNEGAKRLYARFGFKRWGTAQGYIKRGKRYIDLEYMSLRLKK
jgi:RimJ/RimL family protein N-acetyltransferase